ncbi:MAG: MFS transporter [Acidobacteria bacterium]|nr:MFS transporter [Acidobacteriota bacterium]
MPVLALLWIAFALNYLDRQMVYSMFPALKGELGFDGARLGLIGSVFGWVYTLSMPFAGRLADVWRRDVLIVASLVLWSIAALGCGLAGSAWTFLGWRAVMGVTEALYYPAALAFLSALYPAAARSRALGVHQSAQLFGAVAGGWYGGWAADHVGWRLGFRMPALVGAAYGVALWFGLRRSAGRAPGARSSAGGSVAELVRSRRFVVLCLAFAAYCAMQWIFFAWFPSFLQERFRLSMTASGWNATVFVQFASIAGILGGGALADRLRRRWPSARLQVAAFGVLLCAPFAYLTFSAATLDQARLFSAGFGLFGGLLAANAFSGAYDVLSEDSRGLAGGVLNMTGGVSSATMIYLAGVWKDTIGFPAMMAAMSAAAVACALLLAVTAGDRGGASNATAP